MNRKFILTKLILFPVFFGTALFLPLGLLHANGQPSAYIITIKSLELKNNAGQWVMITEPDHPVDLVKNEPSVSFFNNGKVPAGEYINFRLAISDTVKVSGSDGIHRTREGGIVLVKVGSKNLSDLPGSIFSLSESVPAGHTGPEGFIHVQYVFHAPEAKAVIHINSKKDFEPLTIAKGTFLNLSFTPDFTNTICYAKSGSLAKGCPKHDAIFVLPPAKLTQAVVTVDQSSRVFAGDTLVMEL